MEWLTSFGRRHTDELKLQHLVEQKQKHNVNIFFKTSEEIVLNYDINPFSIWNVDESILSTVQKPQRVYVTSGKASWFHSKCQNCKAYYSCVLCEFGRCFIPPASANASNCTGALTGTQE
jgi:hypothetical protein